MIAGAAYACRALAVSPLATLVQACRKARTSLGARIGRA